MVRVWVEVEHGSGADPVVSYEAAEAEEVVEMKQEVKPEKVVEKKVFSGPEQVLVFPAELLEPYLKFFIGGMEADPLVIEKALDEFLHESAAGYMDRGQAEKDESFKQVIPYTVLWKRPAAPLYFGYRRTKKGGEARLHEKWSVGVGGHVNPSDEDGVLRKSLPFAGLWPAYSRAFWRELSEEVSLNFPAGQQPQAPVRALIYDDSEPVGRVHLGVVHFLEVPDGASLDFHDPALAEGQWHTPAMLREKLETGKFENWSASVVRRLVL